MSFKMNGNVIKTNVMRSAAELSSYVYTLPTMF
jgi:hypothetical protein